MPRRHKRRHERRPGEPRNSAHPARRSVEVPDRAFARSPGASSCHWVPGAHPDLGSFARGSGREHAAPRPLLSTGTSYHSDPLEAVRTRRRGSRRISLAGTTTEEIQHGVRPPRRRHRRRRQPIRRCVESGLSADGGAGPTATPCPASTGADILGQAMTDRIFRVPTEELCRCSAVAPSGSTYLYQSAWRSSGLGGILGAAHCIDVPFAFDNLDGVGCGGRPGVRAASGVGRPDASSLGGLRHRPAIRAGPPIRAPSPRSTMVFDRRERREAMTRLRLPRSLWASR